MRACTLCRRLFVDDQSVCPDDANPVVQVELDALPEAIAARFPDAVPMARGMAGTLYRVDDSSRVCKVLSQRLTHSDAERARHRRELQRQLGLSHPNVPRVLEEGESNGCLWLLREFVRGESLAVRTRREALSLPVAIDVMAQLASALDGLHRRGIVHGDIRPGHVMLRKDPQSGRLKALLLDAGLAAPLSADDSGRSGSVAYAAPELTEGAGVSQSADLYALGCLSYELVAKRRAFEGGTALATLAAHQSVPPPPLEEALPSALRALIESMLSKDARRRPFSAQQVWRSLQPLLEPALRESATPGSTLPPAAPDATVGLGTQEIAALAVPESQSARPVADDGVGAGDASSQGPAEQAEGKGTEATSLREDTAKYTIARQPSQPGVDRDSRQSLQSLPHLASSSRARFATHNGLGPKANAVARAVAAQPEASRTTLPPVALSGAEVSRPSDSAGDANAERAAAAAPAAAPERPAATPREPVRSQPSQPRPARKARPLSEHPSIVLWSAGALVMVMALARVVRGPVPIRARAAVVELPLCRLPVGLSRTAAAPSDGRLISGATAARGLPSNAALPAVDPLDGPDAAHEAMRAGLGVTSTSEQEPAGGRLAPEASASEAAVGAGEQAQATAATLAGSADGAREQAVAPSRATMTEAEDSAREPGAKPSQAAMTQAADSAREPGAKPSPALAAAALGRPANSGALEQTGKQRQGAAGKAGEASGSARSKGVQAAQPGARGEPREGSAKVASAKLRKGKQAPTPTTHDGSAAASAEPAPAAPSSAPDHKERARQLFQARKFREAADAYRAATQQNGADAGAFAGLGASLLAAGDARGAVAAYARAAQLQPRVSGFHAALGRAYLVSGDRERARAAYSTALKLDPNNRAARAGLASAQ